MALTIVVVAQGSEPELTLSLDAPRMVLGRGDGCDVRLPDLSVSHRHASIRQRGVDYVLIDENSTNGTYLSNKRLTPNAPEVLHSGDHVHIGRVHLAIRIEAIPVQSSTKVAAKELAIELVARGLAAQGEDPTPTIVVTEGPDAGRRLCIGHEKALYILGRSKDADLELEDYQASRRHVALARRADHFVVRNLSAQGEVVVEGTAVGETDVVWKPGQALVVGQNQLAYTYPAVEALAEIERSPDEPMAMDEAPQLPEPEARPSAPVAEAPPRPRQRKAAAIAPSGGWSITDGLVLLISLGVLVLSIAGLVWLLGRG